MPLLRFSVLPDSFGIAQLAADADFPVEVWSSPGFASVSRCDDELSIVCAQSHLPSGAKQDPGWSALKLAGPFNFDQVGVLRAFVAPLAEAKIGIFAISTFNTDYVLVKTDHLSRALEVLEGSGHRRVD